MARLTRIYTRTGDDGTTGLGTGQRVPKVSQRIEAYGVVDELNAALGMVLAASPAGELLEPLRRIQNQLFHLGADLCVPEYDKERTPGPRIEATHVDALESLIDHINDKLPPLENFILPGGSSAGAAMHLARTICRRAEREVLRLAREEAIGEQVVKFLNRLSDALFVMARYQNAAAGVDDPLWDSRA